MTAGTMTADGRARVLADGNEIPLLGLGRVAGPRRAASARTRCAGRSRLGYRHIDTAQAYGNERSVGRALRDSGVPREEVFITTKFYPGRQRPGGRGAAEPGAARRRLRRPLHHPLAAGRADVGVGRDAARAANAATRARSASRTSASRELDELLGVADVPPVVNQVQFSPFEFRRGLLEACEERGVALEAYSPLGTGRHLGDQRVAEIAERVGPHAGAGADPLVRAARARRAAEVDPPRAHRGRTRRSSTSRSPTRTWRRSTRWTRPAAPTVASSAPGGDRRHDLGHRRP